MERVEVMPIASSLMFSFVAIITAIGAHLADYSSTHLFNPAWPGHAKYHAGHTMALSALLGVLTLFFAWRPGGDVLSNLIAAAGFASIYWISQSLDSVSAYSFLRPGIRSAKKLHPRAASPGDVPDRFPVHNSDRLPVGLAIRSVKTG